MAGAVGQSVLDGQEPEKVNMALAVWLPLEPRAVRSWGNSDPGLSQQMWAPPCRDGQALGGTGLALTPSFYPLSFPQ